MMVEIEGHDRFFMGFRVFFPDVGKKEDDKQKIQENDYSGNRSERCEGCSAKQSSEYRSEREPDPEHRSEKPHILGSILCCRYIRDIGLSDRSTGAAESGEKACDEEYKDIPRKEKEEVSYHVETGCEDEYPFPSIDVGEPSEDDSSDEHSDRESRKSYSDPVFSESEPSDDEREYREDNPKSEDIEESGGDDDKKGFVFSHGCIGMVLI